MSPHLILLTRSRPEAERTAQALRQRGHASLIAPLTEIEPTGEPLPEGLFTVLLATSAKAAAPAAAEDRLRSLPVFCVGVRTAEAFRAAGFTDVRDPAADRHALGHRLAGSVPPAAACLAILGEDRHEDWLEALERQGHAVTRWTVYRARALEHWSPEALAALDAGKVSAVLHFSPRQAGLFLDRAGHAAARTAHVALSAAIAAPLLAAGLNPAIASGPDEAHLLERLDQTLAALPAPAPIGQDAVQQGAGTGATDRSGTDIMARKANRTDRAAQPVEQPADGASPEPAAAPEAVTIEPAAEEPAPVAGTAEPVAAPAPASEPARGGTSPAALLIAALLGGGLAGGAALALPKFLPALAPAPVADPRIAAMDQRLAALEAALATAARGQAELKAAMEAAAKRFETLPAASGGGTDAAALARLTERLARIEASQPEIARLQREAQDALKISREAGDAARRDAAAISQRLASAEQVIRTPAVPSAPAQAALRLALLDRVRTSLATGQPFEAEMAALQSHGLAAEALRPLAALAKGAPRVSALLDTVRRERKVLSEDVAATKQGWGDRLLQMADQLVQVRRVDGPANAPTPAGLTLAIEQALAAGDVAQAAANWNRLPEPARRATAGLGEQLAARAAAERALSALTSAELAAAAGR